MQVTLRIVTCGCLFLCLAVSTHLQAQERGAAAAAEDGAKAAVPDDEASAPGSSTSYENNRWRYKRHDGHWWYWLPNNRWVVWMDGRWVDPPTHSIESYQGEGQQYQSTPQYVAPAPRLLTPRPRSWYYTNRVYDGPYYYYDEFYEPYGGARPYPYYPDPRPYSRRPYYGRYPYYAEPGVGFSIGGGRSGVRIGIGF